VDLAGGHDFVGKVALEKIAQKGANRTLIGLIIDGHPTPPGHHLALMQGAEQVGYVSEFTFSKRLDKKIGIGQLRADLAGIDTALSITIADSTHSAHQAAIPFV
jgi:aminomethyltransferase